MPKLSDIKKKSKANNPLKTDVRIGHIDESISEIFHVPIEKKDNTETSQGHHRDKLGVNLKQSNENNMKSDKVATKVTTDTQKTSKKLETNLKQTGKIKRTNRRQIADKWTAEQTTNRRQIDDSITDFSSNRLHQADRIDDKIDYIKRTNSGQIDDKVPVLDVNLLSGNERIIFQSIFRLSQINGNRICQKITIDILLEQTSIRSKTSLKKSLERLTTKGFLVRMPGKKGRGGWMVFEIPEHVYSKAFLLKDYIKRTNSGQIADKWTAEQTTEQTTTSPSSSSTKYIYNTTTTGAEFDEAIRPDQVVGQQKLGPEFDSDWQSIDIEPLSSIGFSHHHLSQLFTRNELSPKQVQDSINAFAFDLDENKRADTIKTSPLNLLMGILKKGMSYNPPKNYESDEDRVLREQAEAERDRLANRKQVQAELNELKYQNWLLELSIEQKSEYLGVPIGFFEKMPLKVINEGLKKHFEMKVL